MPALITHHLFGEESIDRLPQGVITSDEERIAFILGNQGPDPFFFHILTPRVSDCTLLAQVMHRSRMSRQFACLRDGVSHLLPRDASLGRAFALGLLSHYVLDRNAHPFVYEQPTRAFFYNKSTFDERAKLVEQRKMTRNKARGFCRVFICPIVDSCHNNSNKMLCISVDYGARRDDI